MTSSGKNADFLRSKPKKIKELDLQAGKKEDYFRIRENKISSETLFFDVSTSFQPILKGEKLLAP